MMVMLWVQKSPPRMQHDLHPADLAEQRLVDHPPHQQMQQPHCVGAPLHMFLVREHKHTRGLNQRQNRRDDQQDQGPAFATEPPLERGDRCEQQGERAGQPGQDHRGDVEYAPEGAGRRTREHDKTGEQPEIPHRVRRVAHDGPRVRCGDAEKGEEQPEGQARHQRGEARRCDEQGRQDIERDAEQRHHEWSPRQRKRVRE